ncbi:MAG: hypothetical protein ING73_14375 [Rhodocyclaceae bacterium]|nr:hypothetical protein [Rhodocyclaceae bacterium]
MPSPAINGQGAQVSFGQTQGTAITATAATAASPVVVTATNTLTAGALVVCTAQAGQTELVNRAFIATTVSGTAFTLFGEDGTGRTVGTAGTYRPWTMTAAAGADAFKDASSGGSANNVIDITTLTSVNKEYLAGLPDSPTLQFSLMPNPRDATFQYLRRIQKARTIVPILVRVPNPDTTATAEGRFFYFVALGFVQSITEFNIGIDTPLSASVQFKCSNGLEVY